MSDTVNTEERERSLTGMVPEDVYELAGTADPRLSPDGRMIAYVAWGVDRDRNAYRSAIDLVPVDGSAPARQRTSGD